MRDLELRGAGNLLGDEQSGHVAAVGFELYCELLAEAVAELQGAPPAAARPVRVEAQVDAYVPADYVPLEAVKIDLHRRVALAVDRSELREIEAELADRFGPLPEPVANLLAIQELRLVAAEMGMAVAMLRGGTFTAGPVALGSAEVRRLRELFPAVRYSVATRELSLRPVVEPPATRPGVLQGLELLDAIIDIRREIAA
jgi:transcription-repair coupling factor (superfamily II helicase)